MDFALTTNKTMMRSFNTFQKVSQLPSDVQITIVTKILGKTRAYHSSPEEALLKTRPLSKKRALF